MSSLTNVTIENPGSRELRKFGLIFGGIVAVLFGLLLPWAFGFAWPVWPWVVAAISGFWGLAHPDSFFVFYRVWMKFGHIAGWINTRIILGIMFYLLFFPVGILMRLVAKDPMARKLDSGAQSYRIVSEAPDKNHIERPY